MDEVKKDAVKGTQKESKVSKPRGLKSGPKKKISKNRRRKKAPQVQRNVLSDPWEQQPGESMKAFEVFCAYRDLGPKRSIERAAHLSGKRWTNYVRSWSAKYHWVARAKAYDVEQDRKKRALEDAEREKMAERHLKVSMAMIDKAFQAVEKMKPESLMAQDVSRLVEVASKLERLTRGEKTESVETFGKEGAPPAVQIYIPENGREKKNK